MLLAALPVSQPSVLRMAGTPRSQPYTPTRWLRSRRASHPYHGWLQLQDPSHSALQARAILAAFQPVQPSSGRWLRWLCPGHPPGRMMAVIQPSQPFGRRMAVANSTQPSRRPDTSPGGSTLAPRASHHTLFWMAGVVISQPSRWNAWSGSSKLSHPPADGCDGCMTAILRPGGWLGHSHRSHRPEDGCTGWKAAKMARAGRAEWLGSCNCSHAY